MKISHVALLVLSSVSMSFAAQPVAPGQLPSGPSGANPEASEAKPGLPTPKSGLPVLPQAKPPLAKPANAQAAPAQPLGEAPQQQPNALAAAPKNVASFPVFGQKAPDEKIKGKQPAAPLVKAKDGDALNQEGGVAKLKKAVKKIGGARKGHKHHGHAKGNRISDCLNDQAITKEDGCEPCAGEKKHAHKGHKDHKDEAISADKDAAAPKKAENPVKNIKDAKKDIFAEAPGLNEKDAKDLKDGKDA